MTGVLGVIVTSQGGSAIPPRGIKPLAAAGGTQQVDSYPRQLGKYEVIRPIGRGSMGTVYAAFDPFLDREVAVKVAHPEILQDEELGSRFRKLFFNEAHAAGMLDHPNILKVHDAGVEGDYCYLVMEYVAGARTLEPYCKADALLPVRQVVNILYKTAKALDYAHGHGVVHRDIKPSNILLTEHDDIRLADFSIAMITASQLMQTQVKGFLGSPLYMSPEQINEAIITHVSDLFSLGSMTYQLLTGRHPFQGENLNVINRKITHEQPPPLTELRHDIPEGLDYVVRRMLKKNPDARYHSGLDLAADLAVIFDDLEAIHDENALKEKFAAVKDLGFFKEFTDSEIWELIRAGDWATYPKGSEIIREGDSDQSVYIILAGMAEVGKGGSRIQTLQAGDCFGEMGYLAHTTRSATVTALSEVSLMMVNSKTIGRASTDAQLRFLKVFVKTLIERLSETTSALSQANARLT